MRLYLSIIFEISNEYNTLQDYKEEHNILAPNEIFEIGTRVEDSLATILRKVKNENKDRSVKIVSHTIVKL